MSESNGIFNVQGDPIRLPVSTSPQATASALDAAALSKFYGHMHRHNIQGDQFVVREAFMAGFRAGGKWSIEAMAILSTPDVRRAFLVLGDLYGQDEPA